MVTLRNPEAPATSKQLWRLHQLTKDDTRDLDLTMREASDRISKLENGCVQALPKSPALRANTPFDSAHVTFITGDQGGGKSVTAVARVRDGYDKDCVRIFCEEVLKIKCVVKSF